MMTEVFIIDHCVINLIGDGMNYNNEEWCDNGTSGAGELSNVGIGKCVRARI